MESRTSQRQILGLFAKHVWQYKYWLIAVGVFVVAAELFNVIVPLFYKQFFDALASEPQDPAVFPEILHLLFVIFSLHFGNWGGYRVASFLNNYFQPRVAASLDQNSFEYVLGHAYRFFTGTMTGALTRKLRRLSEAFISLSDTIIWDVGPLIVGVSGALIAISTRSPLIALVFVGWIVLFVVINFFFSRWKQRYDKKLAKADSEVTGVLTDVLGNSLNVKLFSGQKQEQEQFRTVREKLRRLQTFTWNVGNIGSGVQWGIMLVVEFVVMYIAVRLWSQGELTVGDFALFQGYIFTLFGKVQNLGRIIQKTFENLANAQEMIDLLHAPHEITDAPHANPLTVSKGDIQFDNVGFRYEDEKVITTNFNLHILPGEKIALVGPSGSGKTTLTKLLFRFFDIQKGEIRIDDQPIDGVTQESLRKHIALVPQEPILFHRSLMENIRYSRPEATEDEVIEAAKQAHCHEFIQNLSSGYATLVGERGVKLSGGERQRVALARAFLKNAPILVLDEATSSLDSESEAYIQEALETLMRGKTTIVIAHRLSTILKMDRIIVLKDGEIIDQGPHSELIKKPGLYKKLWDIQVGGFLE